MLLVILSETCDATMSQGGIVMRPKLEEMTLRERIGQTGMPSPTNSRDGVLECGGYAEYFTK